MLDVGLNWSSLSGTMFLQSQPVLAQVVFGANPAAFLGVALAVAGAGLYFLRTFRPNLVRDQDIALSAVILLAGFIMFFQGWRLDPILTFGCFLLAACATAFALEALRLRGATIEQAKRSTPLVDDDRPVSRVYRAELDELSSQDERPISRRIRGSKDYRSNDVEDYGDARRRPSIRGGSSDRPSSSRSSSKRRSSEDRYSRSDRSNSWDDDYSSTSRSAWDDEPPRRTSSDRPSRSSDASRPRRSRPTQDDYSRRAADDGESPANYVDYQPINYSDDEIDNSGGFDRT